MHKQLSPATRVARGFLVGLELAVGFGAVGSGVGLIANNAIKMTPDWLAGTPFDSWTLPGFFLLLVVAAPMTVAAVAELRRLRWAYAASLLAGAAQVAWICAQWPIMQRFFFLQPVMLTAGIAVLVLAWAVHGASRFCRQG